MKDKLLPISLGLVIGVVMTAIMISLTGAQVAYGEGDDGGSFWNKVVAASDSFSWSEVFDANDGQDLYVLIYKKTVEYPERDALRDLAANYGMTTAEAQAVLDGSVSVIFNSPNRKGTVLTQEDAMLQLHDIQENYKFIKELYDVQQEVDMAIKPSELFANGDLSDSGFDLINDLNTMEKILFLNETANTVGGDYAGALDSPNNATERDETFKDYVASDTPIAVNRLSLSQGAEPKASLQIGDAEIDVELLDEDVCVLEDPTKAALDQFAEEEAQKEAEAAAAPGGGAGGNGGIGVEDIVGFDDPNVDANKQDGVEPAAPSKWGSAWCPGLPDSGGGAVDNFSEEGVGDFLGNFKSLGGSSPGPLYAGASARAESGYGEANAAICMSLQLVRETLSSYNPGDSCIQCEVEKINALMEKTLSHTLIPSKATGNLLESAKCKQTGGALLNMQLITIWNPIPTPPNDELIFGKNIFEEWNDFADRYQPALLNKIKFSDQEVADKTLDGAGSFTLGHAPSGSSQIDILNQVKQTADGYAAEAAQQVKIYQDGDTGSNQMLYLQNVLAEMREMNNLFKSFRDIYGKINTDAIAKIKEKPNIP